VAQRPRWLDDGQHWQERCQAVEDRLSDSLHNRLVERFVERRRRHGAARPHTRPSRRGLGEGLEPAAATSSNPFHQLLGLRLACEPQAEPAVGTDDRWVNELADAPHARFSVDARGSIFASTAVREAEPTLLGHLTRGVDLLHPEIKLTFASLPGAGARARILRRLLAFTRDLVEESLGSLRDERVRELSAAGRGLVYQLEQGLGTALADRASTQLGGLSEADRSLFAGLGVELGYAVIYVPRLLKPAAVARRLALCAAFLDRRQPPWSGQAAVSFGRQRGVSDELYLALGYPVFGPRAIRADLAERSAARLRAAAAEGPFDLPAELSTWLGCGRSELVLVARALGFRRGREGWMAA
jgi:ATP-dependent RNA helicase SUPV3L1/SUV3